MLDSKLVSYQVGEASVLDDPDDPECQIGCLARDGEILKMPQGSCARGTPAAVLEEENRPMIGIFNETGEIGKGAEFEDTAHGIG